MAISLPPSGEGGEDKYQPMAEINVTPMVDVMLVLLIIFMVTAPLLVAGVPVDLPDSKAGAPHPEARPAAGAGPAARRAGPVQVSLDRAGAIFVDEQPVAAADLPARLAAIAGSSR